MDFASLKDQVTNLSLYDLKAGVRKVQNGKLSRTEGGNGRNGQFAYYLIVAVMNYTEMEAKVRRSLESLGKRKLTFLYRSEKQPTMSLGGLLRQSCKRLPMGHIASW